MHGRMARWRVAARCRRQLEGADRWHWVGEADRWVLPAGAGVGRVAFGLAIWLSVWPRPNAVGAVGEQAGQLAGAGAARWPAVQQALVASPQLYTHANNRRAPPRFPQVRMFVFRLPTLSRRWDSHGHLPALP